MRVELETQSVVAGENVSYTVSFTDPMGEVVDDFSWHLSSDIEEALQWTSKQVIDTQENATDSEEFEDEDTTSEDLESSENTINGVGNIRPLISGNHDCRS